MKTIHSKSLLIMGSKHANPSYASDISRPECWHYFCK